VRFGGGEAREIRASLFVMVVLQGNDPELYERIQEINLIRQYELLTNCIEIGLQQGPTAFDRYMLWSLNHIAVANISQLGGRFREEPVYVGNRIPPHFKEVSELMDRFVSFIHENWFWLPPLNWRRMHCGE
jgi:Fic family protein